MVNKRYIKTKNISLAQQGLDLCKMFPDSNFGITRGRLWWKAKVQPTPLSRKYNIELRYCPKKFPDIYVVGDELQNLDSDGFPHHYSIDIDKKRVCLCLFRYYDFSSDKLLNRTVVPWAIEWLYFYEIWLSTGEWHGGGEHPKR